MATIYNLAITRNPNFNTVLGLTNTVFDRNNVRSGQMATEDQIQQLWQDIIRLEERIDYCCRDIVFWDIQIRIKDRYGNVITDFLENRTTGIARRGKNFTMRFPLKAVPKYEIDRSIGTQNQYFVDGDPTSCIKNGEAGGNKAFIADFCSLLYRGNSGEYFDMSTRKTTNFLAVGIYGNADNITVQEVGETGNILSPVANAYYNKLFARTNDDNDILIDSYWPIDVASASTKSYGRIIKFTLWDVTLGG